MLLTLLGAAAHADVTLPRVFGDNMVLQRDMATPFWGWADPGEMVTVTLGNASSVVVKAAGDGTWRVTLPARPAGGPMALEVRGRNTVMLENVLVGDVWVCSGQSNMAWPMFKYDREQMAAATHPALRLFTVPRRPSRDPQGDCDARWLACGPGTVNRFSAVAYYFGRELQRELGVPIGLVNASCGDTPIGTWTPRRVLEADPAYAGILDRHEERAASYPDKLKEYEAALPAWERAAAAAVERGEKAPPRLRKPVAPDRDVKQPGVLFNGMVCPLIPMAIKGVIWYQGESNGAQGFLYRSQLPDMIRAWRGAWGQGDFPFGIVQLPRYGVRCEQPADSRWAELREAQALAARDLSSVGLVTTIDLGEANNIHPPRKDEVGRRLGLWALSDVYGKAVNGAGPVVDLVRVEEGAVRVTFQRTAGGLVAGDSGRPKGFAIAGEDRAFVWATAEIDGDSVIVSSPDVPHPVAVRYAWADNPDCNLLNKARLPAGPFRTDDWPLLSAKGRE